MKNAYIETTADYNVPITRLDDALNPFKDEKVVIWVLCGQKTDHVTLKAGMTYQMLDNAKRAGKLEGVQHVVVASSGATALSAAVLARDDRFGIPNTEIVAVIKNTVPDGKRLPVVYAGVNVIEPHLGLGGIETARVLGRQEGWYCLDQYADMSNPNAYRDHLAPHIVRQMEPASLDLLVAGVGTGGTIIGLSEALRNTWKNIHIVGAMCVEKQTIPGLRSESQMTEIHLPCKQAAKEFIEVESFLAHISPLQIADQTGMMMGISAGATYVAMLMHLKQHKLAGTLDALRGSDGNINAMFVAHDGLRTYTANRLPPEVEQFRKQKHQQMVWDLLD